MPCRKNRELVFEEGVKLEIPGEKLLGLKDKKTNMKIKYTYNAGGQNFSQTVSRIGGTQALSPLCSPCSPSGHCCCSFLKLSP